MHKGSAGAIVKSRILIVDDNADLRRLYAIGLNQRGYEVRLAANGAEALDRMEQDPVDLIILDVQMPVLDGWGFIDRLSATQSQPIPILILSGYPPPSDKEIPGSVIGWVNKPATIDDVCSKLVGFDVASAAS